MGFRVREYYESDGWKDGISSLFGGGRRRRIISEKVVIFPIPFEQRVDLHSHS